MDRRRVLLPDKIREFPLRSALWFGKISNQDVFEMSKILLDIVASDATGLITDENGTGKELFATAIHNLSPRRERPFFKGNSRTLPKTLFESELLGYPLYKYAVG